MVMSVIVRVSTFFCNLYVYDLHSNFYCLAVVDYTSYIIRHAAKYRFCMVAVLC